MSDPEESGPFEGKRSMLASIGARRRWFIREPPEPVAAVDDSSEPEDSDEPFAHGMLGSLASHAGPVPAEEPRRASRLALGGTKASTEDRAPGAGTVDSGEDEDSDELFAHGMLGSLASHSGPVPAAEPRRASRLALGRTGASTEDPAPAARTDGSGEDQDSDEPFAHGMLGSLASQSGSAHAEEPRRASFLALGGTDASTEDPEPAVLPLTAHSTLGELAGLEEHATGAFPIERAILISLCAHLLLVILLIVVPARTPATEGNLIDALAAAMQPPKDESPIPINFHDLPGAPRENPKRSPLSDADRRASGGDPARPKADTPFVPRAPGITGLAPGPRARRSPGGEAQAQARARQAPDREQAERRAALEKAEPSNERKASEFPADMRPSLSNGPQEVTKLAGLDAAIREAARGTIGGEGGAPVPNEDGGFVDVGGVSFETSWYDWGPYAAEMLRRIKLHWRISRDLLLLQQNGSTQIAFSIMADGSVADVRVQRPSGIPPYTHAAMQAILESDPFRPLPKDLLRLVPGKDRERIVIHFIYFPTQDELNGHRDGN